MAYIAASEVYCGDGGMNWLKILDILLGPFLGWLADARLYALGRELNLSGMIKLI